jgi:hypothetical protein
MVTLDHSIDARSNGRGARRRATLLLALVSALAIPLPTQAQEGAETGAQRLFREGRQAIERGDYATGCPKFAESLKLVKRASTLLNLAQCEEHEGRLFSALEHWRQGADMLEARDERLPIARGKVAAIEQRLPRVTLVAALDLPKGTELTLDGAPLPPAMLGVEAPLDPGRHSVKISAPERADVEISIELTEGERRRVDLKAGAPLRMATFSSAPTPAADPVVSRRTLGFIAGGVGIAGLVAAGVTGVLVLSRDADIEEQCPDKRCSAEGRELIDGAGPLLVGNAIAWAVGVAGLGTGAFLLVTSGSGGAPRAVVSPTALPAGAGLRIEGTF